MTYPPHTLTHFDAGLAGGGRSWRFVVLTSPDIQNVLRVLNPFAVQGLTPNAVTAELDKAHYRIEVDVIETSDWLALRVLALLNNQPTTRSACLTAFPAAGAAQPLLASAESHAGQLG